MVYKKLIDSKAAQYLHNSTTGIVKNWGRIVLELKEKNIDTGNTLMIFDSYYTTNLSV
jgi:hypothetical protein